MWTSVILMHSSKTRKPIISTLSGKITSRRFVHPVNSSEAKRLILDESVAFVIFGQFSNADPPISSLMYHIVADSVFRNNAALWQIAKDRLFRIHRFNCAISKGFRMLIFIITLVYSFCITEPRKNHILEMLIFSNQKISK